MITDFDVVQVPVGEDGAVMLIDVADRSMVEASGPWSFTNGYAAARGKYLHRILMDCVKGDGKQVDHIDGDRLNNSRQNLRVVTPAQNSQNRRVRHLSASGLRGVSCMVDGRSRPYLARVMVDGVRHLFGYYATAAEAGRAAAEGRRILMSHWVESRD